MTEGEAKPITSETMYKSIIEEKNENNKELRGINALKEFHLKTP
jgi:hypothetical protein